MLTNYLRFFQKKYEKANGAIEGINQQNPVLFLPCHHSTFSQNNGVSPLDSEHRNDNIMLEQKEMKQPGRVTISLDEEAAELFKKVRKELKVSQSELMREALKFYDQNINPNNQ